jgi:hypothetical protein
MVAGLVELACRDGRKAQQVRIKYKMELAVTDILIKFIVLSYVYPTSLR